jgi:hypothetical protein
MKYIPGIIIGIITWALFWVLYIQSGNIVCSIGISAGICISLMGILCYKDIRLYMLGRRKKE